MQGLGLIVCRQGSFQFSLDNKCASAKAGETLFIHEESWVQVLQETEDVEILILAYQIEPIRDIPCICIRNLLRNSLVYGIPARKMRL